MSWFTLRAVRAGSPRAAIAAGLVGALAGSGCSQQDARWNDTGSPPSAGLNQLLAEPAPETSPVPSDASAAVAQNDTQSNAQIDSQSDLETELAQQASRALEVQSILDAAEPPPTRLRERTGAADRPSDSAGLDSLLAAEEPDANDQAAALTADPEREPVGAVEPTRGELAAALAERIVADAAASGDPFADLLALATLEAEHPGVLAQMRAQHPDAFGLLFPEQSELLDRFVDAVNAFRSGEPNRAVADLRTVVDRMRSAEPLSTPVVKLCSRVDGFGRYTEFTSHTFTAGRHIPMIVYTEIEGFTHTRDDGAAEALWKVDLSQEVELRHAADDLLAWKRSAQRITDQSRNKVRDFFLVNQFELPASLTVGRYHLKMITRDEASAGEGEGSVAEVIVPIEVVADPALAQAGDRKN